MDYRKNCFILSQNDYHDKLAEIAIVRENCEKDDKTTPSEKMAMRRLLGKLLWLSVQSRPEIAFELSRLSSRIRISDVSDILALNKLCRYVKSDFSALAIPNIGNPKEWKLAVFSDSSLSNNSDCSTQTGFLVYILNMRSGKSSLITWQSQKLRRIARSTLSEETMACVKGIDHAVLYQGLLEEVLAIKFPIAALTDNSSLIQATYSAKSVSDKRLRVDLTYLKSFIDEQKVEKLVWIPSRLQLADCLTKNTKISVNNLRECVKRANLSDILPYISSNIIDTNNRRLRSE